MSSIRIRSAPEQVADHLRQELARGIWTGTIPGGASLARRLGVGRMTVEGALDILEKEGLLMPQGARRRRLIVLPENHERPRLLRVRLLLYEPSDTSIDYIINIQHQLQEVGYVVHVAPQTIRELGRDPQRIARLVERCEADAWVVLAGSLEILQYFASQPLPAFALFGRLRGVAMAGAALDRQVAEKTAIRRLLRLGHRRIVQMARRDRRLPKPGMTEQAFLDELAAHGIGVGPYHLPDWDDSRAGFHERLESMFRHTPPTAVILQEPALFFAAQQTMQRLGLRVPEDVSLLCTDQDPHFRWLQPSVSHIRWDSRQVVRRVVRWATEVSRGGRDVRQAFTRAEFVEGGTIGPVKRGP